MLDLLFASSKASSPFRAAWEQLRAFGVVPRSRYTTSWEGLTFRQAIHMPLPPYLSPLPVIFRMLAYAVITPFVFLLFLDIGGYIVWRIYEGVSLTGTRTAFYKFRTSPVFTRSRNGSPTISKSASTLLGPSPPRSPETRETSISPISSSASLQDETYGMNSDGELEVVNSSSASSSPGGYHHPLQSSSIDKYENNRDRSSAVSALETSNLDNSIRRRAIHRNSASGGKRFSVGSDDEANDDSRHEERESTPTLTSSTSNPSHLTRSNSLGLGFSPSSAETGNTNHTITAGQNSNPTMYIASSNNSSRVTSGDDLVKIERSPAGSSTSSSYLEDDDAIFEEAKEVR